MKIHVLTAITVLALPFLAFGQKETQTQQTEPQQTDTQTNQTQTTAPATKGKKARAAQQATKTQAKPETGTSMQGQTNVQGRTGVNKTETGTRSGTATTTGTSQTGVTGTSQTTTVSKDEFRTRHSEIFRLGRHPKEFFVQRYGANHFRLIGNTYFVFVDGCWASVDVDGFVYSQRVICPGDPEFIAID